MLEVFAVDAATGARQGAARHRKEIGADGRWGPFVADSGTAYEFVISAPGYATTHLYRSPFARSSDIVNLRAERLAEADKDAVAVVTLTRPRGYFGLPRDRITLDGVTPAPGIPQGVAGVASSKLKLGGGAGRPVAAEYRVGRHPGAHRRPGLAGRREPGGGAGADVLKAARYFGLAS